MNKIIKFNDMLLLESKSGYFSFTYKDEPYKFEGKTKKGIFVDIVEWLYKNNYDFKSVKVFDSVPDGHRKDHYHNIGDSNRFIDINFIKQYQGLILMLSDFGVNKESISFGEVDSDGSSKESSSTSKKYTFIEAAQIILKQNENKPMTALEIWEEANSQNLVETLGKTPKATMNAQIIVYSDNTTAIGKKKNSIFRIIEDRPYKFILLNPNEEVQPVPDELDNSDILPPSDFIKSPEKTIEYVKNPFGCKQKDGKETSAICILGESGAGKSYRVRKTLQSAEHKYIIVSPTSATTNLLVQYDRGDYVLSTLGEFIKRAVEDPNSYYTAVLDEGHKYIKMIDDELLQCLSSKRNDGVRFISFDNPIFKRLYDFLKTDDDFGGVGLIPDNLGFILISSKRDAILNADIRNRISVINLDKSHQDIEFAIDKLKELIEDSEDDGYSNE